MSRRRKKNAKEERKEIIKRKSEFKSRVFYVNLIRVVCRKEIFEGMGKLTVLRGVKDLK
jgi:hypothetical protein